VLPGGAGGDLVKARCSSCHETDLIASQRLSLAGWTREVDKMARWGAAVSDADRAVLQPYLAERYGVRPAAAHGPDPAGEATFARACLTCHDRDIVSGQRLTPTGWTREVEKMMRWGAPVGDADKGPLVNFLAASFPPR
jgi:cytochrome c5